LVMLKCPFCECDLFLVKLKCPFCECDLFLWCWNVRFVNVIFFGDVEMSVLWMWSFFGDVEMSVLWMWSFFGDVEMSFLWMWSFLWCWNVRFVNVIFFLVILKCPVCECDLFLWCWNVRFVNVIFLGDVKMSVLWMWGDGRSQLYVA